MLDFSSGDILESNAYILVNPVNCVGAMGKGLALQFRCKYPAMYRKYRAYCKNGLLNPGDLLDYVIENPTTHTHYVYNVATKDHWSKPSEMYWINVGLHRINKVAYYALRVHYPVARKNMPSLPEKMEIAIPALGCGEGGLKFEEVYKDMERVLCNLDAKITIYLPR